MAKVNKKAFKEHVSKGRKGKAAARHAKPVRATVRKVAKRLVVKKPDIKIKKTAQKGSEKKPEPTKVGRREIVANLFTPEEVRAAVGELSRNEAVVGYLKKNVSKRALDVVNSLDSPKTDEALAEQLEMKINAVRRILNILQGYGVTNYYIAKNVNGWLSFAWYINVSKLPPFLEHINKIENKMPAINDDCNDYFRCNSCYDQTKLVFTFDAAYEQGFKCGSCNKNLIMMNKLQASQLLQNTNNQLS